MTSFLLPRLVFRGQFVAAPSTINNWSGTFQNAPVDFTQSTPLGRNNWNAFGGADVRIINTRLVDAVTATGQSWDGSGGSLVIESDYSTSVAKIGDQDPMMQLMSRIFGLHFVIKDPATGKVHLKGEMHEAAFTDISGSTPYGPMARYTSAVRLSPAEAPGAGNAALQQLYDLAGDKAQTIGLTMMVGAHFHSDQSLEWANTGQGTFILGPLDDDLDGLGNHQVVFQRRLLPSQATFSQGLPSGYPPQGLDTVYMAVSGDVLTVDMASAMASISKQLEAERAARRPMQTAPDVRFQEQAIGKLVVAALNSDCGIVFGPTEIGFQSAQDAQNPILGPNDKIQDTQFTKLAELDFAAKPNDADSLLETTGLVFDFSLSAAQAQAASTQPLALLQEASDGYLLVSRETLAGINIGYTGGRAIATKGTAVGQDFAQTRVSVSQYGKVLPASGYAAQLSVAPMATGSAVNTANDAQAFTQAGGTLQTPADALTPRFSDDTLIFTVNQVISSPRKITASDPKAYSTDIAGQLYQFNVEPNVSDAVVQSAGDFITFMTSAEQGKMDFICVLALDTGAPRTSLDFATDVQPIMQQYANLYPIMSRYLFDIADKEQMQKHAAILYFAFNAPQSSPHYMPVTRDMAQWQRRTICNWLTQFMSAEQIGALNDRVAAAAMAGLPGAPPPTDDTRKTLFRLAEHTALAPGELADTLAQLDLPLADVPEDAVSKGTADGPTALLRQMRRARRQMRRTRHNEAGQTALDDTQDPQPAHQIDQRRPAVANALRDRYAEMSDDYADQFSKAGTIRNILKSSA